MKRPTGWDDDTMSDAEFKDAMVEWSLAAADEATQEKIALYLKRGRRFSELTTEELRTLYVEAWESLAVSRKGYCISADAEDAEFELRLRGDPLPEADTAEAVRIIWQRADQFAAFTEDDLTKMMENMAEPVFKKPGRVN